MRRTATMRGSGHSIRSIVAATLALSATLAACSARSSGTVTETLNRALIAHVDGRTEDADAIYRQVLRRDPTNKTAEYYLGVIAHQAERYPEAETHYRLTLGKDPNYVPALYNLAIVRERIGDDESAIDLYRTLIIIAPEHEGTRLNLGLLLRKRGVDDEADRQLDLVARLRAAQAATSTALPAPTPT